MEFGIKGKLFEKSLYLHKKIAKKAGVNIVLEPINSVIVNEEKEKKGNVQNELYYKQVFEKKYIESVDLNHLDIAFIVPDPIKGSGGHRNIYRAVKYLKKQGHDLTVYYINTNLDADTVKKQVCDWFYDMEDIPFISYDGKMGYHDVAVATWWETAYCMYNNADKIKYQFNMVQDYEPAFYPMSSNAILAENTYKKDVMFICSGPWVKTFLNKKYNARAEYFQFPVNRSIYNCDKPRTKRNKNIIFFAKSEMYRRCYEIGIMALEQFHKLEPDVEIILFGSNQIGEVPFPCTKMGLLPTLDDLADLYRNADLGIVFSTTNPSLVPYEMMHCGCPVVDLDVDYALSKYGDDNDNIILSDPQPEILAQTIQSALNNQDRLESISKHAREWVNKEFPSEDEMGQIVEKIIKNEIQR